MSLKDKEAEEAAVRRGDSTRIAATPNPVFRMPPAPYRANFAPELTMIIRESKYLDRLGYQVRVTNATRDPSPMGQGADLCRVVSCLVCVRIGARGGAECDAAGGQVPRTRTGKNLTCTLLHSWDRTRCHPSTYPVGDMAVYFCLR